MSAFPDPATSIFPYLTLSSSDGSAVSFDVRVDLVGRAIVVSPRAPLEASTTYLLGITASGGAGTYAA